MTGDKSVHNDIKGRLGPFPILDLIPKQDLFNLLSSNSVDVDQRSIDHQVQGTLKEAKLISDELNMKPQKFQNIVNFMVNEFTSYEDQELDDLKFADQNRMITNSVTRSAADVQFGIVEDAIFKATPNIKNASIDFSDHSSDSVSLMHDIPNTFKESDPISKKLRAIYEQDLVEAKIANACLKDSSSSLKQPQIKSLKRNDNDAFLDSSPVKKPHKNTYLELDDIVSTTYIELKELISGINLHDGKFGDSEFFLSQSEALDSKTLHFIFHALFQISQHHSFDTVDPILLKQIQKLCINSFKECESAKLFEQLAATFKDESNTTSKFDLFVDGLSASRIILLILNNSYNNKEIFVSDYTREVLDFFHTCVEGFISNIMDISYENLPKKWKVKIEKFTKELIETTSLVAIYANHDNIEEYVISKLEYIASTVLFADSKISEKANNLLLSNLGALQIQFCSVLSVIFKNHESQRHFIISEILSGLDGIYTQKSIPKRFKLKDGGSISVVTYLLLTLIQCIGSGGQKISTNETNGSYHFEIQNSRNKIIEDSTSKFNAIKKSVEQIANFLVNKLITNPDSQYRSTLESMTEDLLSLFCSAEWPSSELILSTIYKSLVLKIQGGNLGATAEAYTLELLGMIGGKFFELRSKVSKAEGSDMNNFSILRRGQCYVECLDFVRDNISNVPFPKQAVRFLALRFVQRLKHFINENYTNEHQLAALNSDSDFLTKDKGTLNEANQILDKLVRFYLGEYPENNEISSKNKHARSIYEYTICIDDAFPPSDSLLAVILQILEGNKIKSKTKALKILSNLIHSDPSLLSWPKLNDSISNRMSDPSPLVRDSVIDLIHKFMLIEPNTCDMFCRPICNSLEDKSVQVRKRVLKIAKELYLGTSEIKTKALIASKILKRQHDEDDIVSDMSATILLELWFNFSKPAASYDCTDKNLQDVCSVSAKVMCCLVAFGDGVLSSFEAFLMHQVFNRGNKEFISVISVIMDCSLELFVDHSENSKTFNIESILVLLSIFGKNDSKLLTQSLLLSLQPYLFEIEQSQSTVTYYGLQILKLALSGDVMLSSDFISLTQDVLLKKLSKFSSRELHEAIPCIWNICILKNDTFKLANACISSMRLLRPLIEMSKKGEKVNSNKLFKLLNLLGCFGTYCNFEGNRNLFAKAHLGMKDKETVISICTKFLLYFAAAGFPSQIRKAAIRNVMSICSSHAKLFISEPILNVLDQEFELDDQETTTSIVQGIVDFLNMEDSRAQRLNNVENFSSRDLKLNRAVFHGESTSYINDGICAALVQRYLKTILCLSLKDSGISSLISVKFLDRVVKLGYANPKICIPYIIALEASPNRLIKKISSEMYQKLFDKHESLVDGSYVEGLKLAVRYRKNCSGNIFDEGSFLDGLYQIVSSKYSSRKKLVQSLSKVFFLKLDMKKLEDNTFQRDLIIFAALNTSRIQFCSLEEIFIIMHNIDKVISVEGMNLSDFLSDESNVDSTVPLMKRRILCVQCQALTVLVQVRNYFEGKYGISKERLANFNPFRGEIELRQQPKAVLEATFTLDLEAINNVLKSPENFSMVYTKFIHMLHEFSC